MIKRYDSKYARYRTVIGYIGENGLKPGIAYKLNADNEFVEA